MCSQFEQRGWARIRPLFLAGLPSSRYRGAPARLLVRKLLMGSRSDSPPHFHAASFNASGRCRWPTADLADCFYPPSDECRDFAGVQLAPRIFSTALLSAEAIKLRARDRRRANSSRGGIGRLWSRRTVVPGTIAAGTFEQMRSQGV